jgi:outer membrane protein OmpA-like peptidoglycan-associated protein
VKDKTNLEPIIGATVFIYDIAEGKVLVTKANSNGCFKTPVKKGADYAVKAMQSGYIADCFLVHIDSTRPGPELTLPKDLLLDKLSVNRKFKIENIYYDFDKSFIREDAKPSLNKLVTIYNLVTIMRENPITIELGSHTDSRGSDEYNVRLSRRRAEAAVQYIVSQGIDANRITARGYGETQLVNRCKNGVKCTPEEHQANRRTEFKILTVYEDKTNATLTPDKFRNGEIIDSRLLPDGFFSECTRENNP